MTSRRQRHRFYHFCLVSVCLDISLKTFFMYARPIPVQKNVHFKKLQFLAVTYDMFFFIVVLSALSKLQCVFPLFMQILGTEMTWSQTIIVRECIFNNQNLLFTSR